MTTFQTEPIIRQIIMGYKHTFEIITKDIQEIEKLVGNFENYSEIPYIELDLALSKLRNVYELLLMFRENGIPTVPQSRPIPVREEKVAPATSSQINEIQEDTVGKDAEEHIVVKHIENPATQEKKPAEQSGPVPDTKPTENTKQKDITEPKKNPQVTMSEHERTILAENFKIEKAFINEKLGENTKKKDLSTRLQASPITSISGSMGINDKFFYIRELFKGDADKFRATMDNLEHATNFDEAYNYLVDNFGWDMKSREVEQLLGLVRRKFINA